MKEHEDGQVLMAVPFQRVSLEDASPVKIEPPTEGKVHTMFVCQLRDVAPEDILKVMLNENEYNSESNIRLIELMMNDRKACLKKYREMEAQAVGTGEDEEDENSAEDEVLNRTE